MVCLITCAFLLLPNRHIIFRGLLFSLNNPVYEFHLSIHVIHRAFFFDNNRNDRPARLTALCGVHFYERCLYIFAPTSMSLRDCPLLEDIIGGFLNMLFSKG